MQSTIQFTPSAVAYIKKILDNTSEALGIRLGVKASGCSGLSYVLDFAKELGETDHTFQVEDFQVVIDTQSLPYLEGMEVDCHQEGLNEYLKFNNPNAKGECGCGESFTVEGI